MGSARRCLRINIDETSIPIHQAGPSGNICVSKRRAASLSQPVPRSKRRKCMSYVAVVCDDIALQPLLPQFLVANEHTVLRRNMPSLLEHLPNNVILLRRRSAWVDQDLMVDILKELRRSLLPYMHMVNAVLLWDAARQHIAKKVIGAAFKLGFFPMTIPAGSTYFLQPLDTHVFLKLKKRLQREAHSAYIVSDRGDIDVSALVQCLVNAIESVVTCGNWAHAFDENGFGHLQTRLSDRVRNVIGATAEFACGCERPSLDMVAACFPRRYVLTEAVVFGRMPARPPVARTRLPPIARAPSVPLGRTRSETRLLRRGGRCVEHAFDSINIYEYVGVVGWTSNVFCMCRRTHPACASRATLIL